MNQLFENIDKPRKYLLQQISELNSEQLNKVPKGFNNNIIWNLGHMVAAQQGICYKRANLDILIKEELFSLYKPGTKPERLVSENDINIIKQLLITTIEQLASDYDKGLFQTYPPWETRYGVQITSIDAAIHFLPFHEGIHMGTVQSIKKLVV